MIAQRARRIARRPWGRRLRAALSLFGFGLVFMGSTVAWMAATQAQSAFAHTLTSTELPLHNDTAGPAGDCPQGGAYWHFVLTPNNNTSSFTSIVLNVGGTAFTYTGFPPIIANGGQTDNVFVPVPAGHVVTDLDQNGSYATYSGGSPTKFVLSSVCAGEGGGTTTTAPTTTTAAPTTTTTGCDSDDCETTTTVAPTTTTEKPTTTTAAPTTTTEKPTTTTAAPTTTSCDSDDCESTTTTPPHTTLLPSCVGPAIACNPQPTTTAAPTTVTVVSPVQVEPASATAPTPVAPAELASTGARTAPLVIAAVALIGLGVLSMGIANWRHASTEGR